MARLLRWVEEGTPVSPQVTRRSRDTPGGCVISSVTRSDGTGNSQLRQLGCRLTLRGTRTGTGTSPCNVFSNYQVPDLACIAYNGVDGRRDARGLVANEYIQY